MDYRPVITLTTDFGLADEFVASMKGVILSIAPETSIVDISHLVAHGNIKEGAFLLQRTYPFFPAGTIHCVVIDPGVGTDRHILATKSTGQVFVAPDNGLLSPILRDTDRLEAIHAVTNRSLFNTRVSNTFHGRDIMAPVAAHLAAGLNIKEVGDQLTCGDCVIVPQIKSKIQSSRLIGEIIHIDRFGNICTNITLSELANLSPTHDIIVHVGSYSISGMTKSYGHVGDGELLAHFDSHDHLEISVSGGSAALLTGSRPGSIVTVEQRKSHH
ncbi:S-adenosyl-l-methionine hydroxide adenosyltransferase family protein [Desulfopila sp. IMCC35008]|uniref:SAM hydrolase/SAM-dependent halogenase family protein n=1 Tax=Desulfopila sp. IMCC35008 TaxID=2653858 RepID=UPI0013D4CAA6|nr:SAM-dependent chlorinase/fluorinase [Desulfopila sp. IMCC35008]